MFLNLFLNARDAMEAGGTLAIRQLGRMDNLVWLTVADSGAGIARENLTRIFDPFFTTESGEEGHRAGAVGELRNRKRAWWKY